MRAIKIDPSARTIEEIDVKGDLDSMEAILKDGPCSVRVSRGNILCVGDNGLLSAGNPIFRWANYVHPLAGVGLIIGIDEMGENQPCSFDLEEVQACVIWTDKETTGQLTPSRDFIREDGANVHQVGTGILRDRP